MNVRGCGESLQCPLDWGGASAEGDTRGPGGGDTPGRGHLRRCPPGALPNEAWSILSERLAEVDLLVAPSRAPRHWMAEKLHLSPGVSTWFRTEFIWQDGRSPRPRPCRLCWGISCGCAGEKGLDRLVEAFLVLKRRNRVPGLRFWVAGGMGPTDVSFVDDLKAKLREAGCLGDVEFRPNVEHADKQAFFRGLSVFSTPAHYGEAFGLYLVEAMAAGVPLVQPRTGAFPEILEASGAGLLCAANDVGDLATRIEEVLLSPTRARRQGARPPRKPTTAMPCRGDAVDGTFRRADPADLATKCAVVDVHLIPLTHAQPLFPHPVRRVFGNGHGRNHALLEFLPVHGGGGTRLLPVDRILGGRAPGIAQGGLAESACLVRLLEAVAF